MSVNIYHEHKEHKADTISEDDLESLMANFHVSTLHCMRRDVIQLINDEPEDEPKKWYDRLLRRINHMIEEKS